MDYEEKYTLPDHDTPLRVSWSTDFREVEIVFGDRVIGHFKRRANPLDGILLRDEELGKIELTFHRRQTAIDVVVNDYHQPSNRSHPRRQMKRLSVWFWIVSTFFMLLCLYKVLLVQQGVLYWTSNPEWTIINGSLFLFFAIVAVLVFYAQAWAYYVGFAVFSLIMIYILLTRTIEMMRLIEVVTLLAGLFVMIVMGYHLRTPMALGQKANKIQEGRSDLLDS